MERFQYRIKDPTVAVENREGQRTLITIPADSVVEAARGENKDSMVDVLWNGRDLLMFERDLRTRAELITLHAA